jgi:hypothetical protein
VIILDSAVSGRTFIGEDSLENYRAGEALSCFLPATRSNIILYAVEKQLNEDSRNQATTKSYPQPEHIFLYGSKQYHKEAQKTHHGSENGFQPHSKVSVGSHERTLLPL